MATVKDRGGPPPATPPMLLWAPTDLGLPPIPDFALPPEAPGGRVDLRWLLVRGPARVGMQVEVRGYVCAILAQSKRLTLAAVRGARHQTILVTGVEVGSMPALRVGDFMKARGVVAVVDDEMAIVCDSIESAAPPRATPPSRPLARRIDPPLEALKDVEAHEPVPAAREVLETALGHYVVGQRDAAIASCREALAIDPDLDQAWSLLGSTCHALRRHDEALEAYRRAAALRPHSAHHHTIVGYLAYHLANERVRAKLEPAETAFDVAYTAFRRAILLTDASSVHADAHWYLGRIHVARGDDRDAAEELATALRATRDATPFAELANLYTRWGYLDAARAVLEAGATIASRNPLYLWLRLGHVHRLRRDMAGMIEAFSTVLALEPGHHEALFWRAFAYAESRDAARGRRDALELVGDASAPAVLRERARLLVDSMAGEP
jgi:tetratricopeptide (TPR) repeat protein